jgi:hypothetical protein
LAEITGQRPSDFFEWTDEEDWMERLMFDMQIVGLTKKEEQKRIDKASKKKR